jgi:hypothetical protein
MKAAPSLAALAALATLLAVGCGKEPPAKPVPSAPTSANGSGKAHQPPAAAPSVAPTKPSVTAANGLEMTVRMAKADFLVGEPLDVLATFRNTSGRPFKLFDVDFKVPYGVRIVDADTNVAWNWDCMLEYDRIGGVSAVLRPGESYAARGTIALGSGWSFGAYDFLPPGNYKMTLKMALVDPGKQGYTYGGRSDVRFAKVNEFWTGEIKSDPVRFVVKSNRLGKGDAVNQDMVAYLPKRLAAIGAGAELTAQGDSSEAYRVLGYGWREELYQLTTIEKRGGQCSIEVRRPDDRGITMRFEISPEEWAEFRKRLDYACFWHVPSADGHRGRDGSHVWIEGRAGGERHVVYRWCGGPDAMRACVRCLQDLAARKEQEVRSALDLTVESERAEYESWKDVVINARLRNRSDKPLTLYVGNGQGLFGPQYVAFSLTLRDSRQDAPEKPTSVGFWVSGWRKSHPMNITIAPGATSDAIPLRLAHSTAAIDGSALTLKSYACQAVFSDQRTNVAFTSSNTVRFSLK